MKTLIFFLSIFLYTSSTQSIVSYNLVQSPDWAQETLQLLTLRQKIGQLFIVAAASNFKQPNELLAATMQASSYRMDEEYISFLIKEYGIGGVIFLYKSDPATQMALTEKFQQQSSVPLFITQDCEWGLSMRLDIDLSRVVRYPRNMTLGAINDENIVYDVAHEIGKQCNALGVHINCAPVVDVNNNPHNPVIADRSFGDDPERVAQLGSIFAQGLRDAGIIACAKHFPGHGDTAVDSHAALPVIMHAKERLEALELVPFKKLITQGVGAIMNAHLFMPAFDDRTNRPSSLSYAVVTEELKQRLGFQGLVLTDGLGMKAITDHYKPGELELEAFLAGNDILLCPLDVAKAVDLIEQAVLSGRITRDDLDARVLKILRAKEWAFKNQTSMTRQEALHFFVRPEAYALQEKAYTHALTLVSNKRLEEFCPEFVAGAAVVSIGMDWGNEFVNCLQEYSLSTTSYSAQFNAAELESCCAVTQEVKTVIIGIGTLTKYSRNHFNISPNTRKLLQQLQELGKKLVVVIFGTPYCIPYCNDADALLVAYEDCVPAHRAAAYCLLGKVKAKGKLPVLIKFENGCD